MRRMIFHELKVQLKSLLIWGFSIGLLIVVAVAKFSAFADNPSSLAMLEGFSESFLDALNMRTFNLTTLEGFFGVMFVYFGLLGAMAAGMWGSDSIVREERDKTAEFSLVLPISRSKVVTAKALAGLINSLLLVLITWFISIISVQQYQPTQDLYDFVFLEMLAMFLIEIIFLSVGLVFGCSLKRFQLAGSLVIGVVLATYFISIISKMVETLAFLKYLTPFRYFDATDFFYAGRFEGLYLLLSFGIILISLAGAYLVYNRRDVMV